MSVREYKSEPCPICGHRGWCARNDDGLVLCERPPSPAEVAGYAYRGMAKDGATAMYVEAGKERRPADGPWPSGRGNEGRPGTSYSALVAAHEAAVAALTPALRTALAGELGLPDRVLAELPIGWSDAASHHADQGITGAWIFPEHDGQGRLIGASYRFPAEKVAGLMDAEGKPVGNKSSPAGLPRGLTLPIAWRDMPDPVLVAEGASDVLTTRAVGLSAIGRPSNRGGVEFITQLCRHRRAIVMGENDRKADGRWPGKEGAEAVARRLEACWGRPAPVAYPPEGAKDLRDWVRKLVPAWDAADLPAVRQAILDAVQPPALLLLAQDRDRRGRVTVKVFRWDDGADGAAIHSDRLHVEDAAARRRFAKAVAKVSPETEVEELSRRLLAVPLLPDGTQRVKVLLDQQAESHPQESSTPSQPQDAPPAHGNGKEMPLVFVPGGPATILQSAVRLGGLLAQTGKYYIRGGMVTTVGEDKDGRPILETLRPAALASVFETVAKLMEFAKQKGQFVAQEAICTEQAAKLIQHSAAFQRLLAPIHLLSRCPVLIERKGSLVQVSGYDRDSGILAFGDLTPDMPLEEAVKLLSEMLADFHFATPADRARALAAVVTPAMVFGGLLGGRAPVDLGEADLSQSGKGFRARLTAAIYGHVVKTVTQKKGGVGSLEESFATALVQGYNFISFDNVRSVIDSPALESFLTEDSFLARVPHLAAIEVDPRRVIVQLTSNRAQITTDLANRSSCVRILKRPEDYRFRQYPEGDILEHVRANQPLYLGAVFAVVKAWHAAGKPRTDTTGHDFRPWAGRLDWIVQNIFQAGPLLEGHRQTQVRMATPVLNWLRDVALAVRDGGLLGAWLRAGDLIELVSQKSGAELPGLPEGGDLADEEVKTKVLQAVGRRMAQCFGADDRCQVDGFLIVRESLDDAAHSRSIKRYCFTVGKPDPAAFPYGSPMAKTGDRGAVTRRDGETTAPTVRRADAATVAVTAAADSPYRPPMPPLCDSPMKMANSPMSPMGSAIAPMENPNTRVFQKVHEIYPENTKVMEPIGGIGESGEASAVLADHQEELV